MTESLILAGCTAEPLMGYLKALGVFRLLGEQADPGARMSWSGSVCRLQTSLDHEDLRGFFLNRYQPTPVLAPWNGGSGFYGGGAEPLNAIAGSTSDRLALYRNTIEVVRGFVPAVKPKDEQKERLLMQCRAALADEVVPWLDTCFALGENGPSYFPLLGTGGNDGRLDFTNNFFQRLAEVIAFAADEAPPPGAAGWLASALFANDPDFTPLEKAAIGQFSPGAIGGPNGVQGSFEAGSRVNPWDFVLMIEGTLLFAGSVARRFGANAAARAVFPFSVESVAVGYGSASASEETSDGSRAELWLPLWEVPAGLAEVQQMFAEGRAQIGRRQARNSVEFAVAACLLGVSRGIGAFSRYGFLKRNGLAYLAAPLGRVTVTPRPEARLMEDPPLSEWLDRLRLACRDKEKTPTRYQTALRNIDRAVYEFATGAQTDESNERRGLVNVLRAVGRAERTLANGLSFCKDKHIRPLQQLSAHWLDRAADGSPEFGFAAAIAGVAGRAELGPLRAFLEEVRVVGRYANWFPGSTSAVWSNRSVADNLAAVFRRRQMEAFRAGNAGVPLDSPRPARLADVVAFLHSDTDDEKLADLLWALIAIDWPTVENQTSNADGCALPFEFGVPRLLVERLPLTVEHGRRRIGGSEKTTPDPDVFHILASGRNDAVGQCVDQAARRLKSGGLLVVGYRNRRLSGKSLAVSSRVPAARLLAACLVPLANTDLEEIANAVLYPPETQE